MMRTHTDISDAIRIIHLVATGSTRLGRRNDVQLSHTVRKMLQNQLGSSRTATVCLKVSAKLQPSRLIQPLFARPTSGLRCWWTGSIDSKPERVQIDASGTLSSSSAQAPRGPVDAQRSKAEPPVAGAQRAS